MRRRHFLGTAAAGLSVPALRLSAQGASSDTLLDMARRLAARPFVDTTAPLPPPFAGLTYDSYRAIRPAPGRAARLDLGDRFALDVLPPGLYFPDPVRVDLPTDGGMATLPFSPNLFEFDARYFDEIPKQAPGAGFSGMRLRHPLNQPDRMDEVLVVQGASYFRAIGHAMVYGLSARAVAIGTGGARPEEFPRFTHLRIHPPQGDSIEVEAIIDSLSLAGHVKMTLHPGADTVIDMAVTLLPRVEVANIGIAPLTSMFLKGPMRAAVSDDFRPRVHDSEVLVMENGAGESLWRPVANPARIETSAFFDDGPRAFGLHQIRRRFEDFQDSEARYHDRPSAMVEPKGDWGRGAVMLVELPTGDEFLDNIVAFWRPEVPLATGSEHAFDYRLTWTHAAPAAAALPAPIVQSRSGREHDRPGTRRFVIDVAADATQHHVDLSASGTATLSGLASFLLPGDRGTRITFLLTPGDDTNAVDLRLTLRDDQGAPVSPVWLYRWTRARDGGV